MIRSILTALAVAGTVAAGTPAVAAEHKGDGDKVVARVNGEPIHLSQVKALYKSMAQGKNVPFKAVRQRIVEHMVDMEVVAQAAEKQGLADDPEVKERVSALRKRVIQDVYLNRQVQERLTEKKLREAYEKAVENRGGKPEVHARHILVESEDAANTIIEELDEGASFKELAKKRSTGPSSKRGGDLGWFKKGDMVESFSTAAFKMEPGTVSDEPVKTRFGYHVIKVEDRRKSEAPSFEEMKPKLEKRLSRRIIDDIVGKLREKADVTVEGGGSN